MQNDDLAIQDVPPAAELLKRLSIVEKNAMEKVQSLESQVANLQSQLAAVRVLPDSPLKDLPCFAPYKKEDGRIILSSVVSDTKEWYQSALRKLFLAVKGIDLCITNSWAVLSSKQELGKTNV